MTARLLIVAALCVALAVPATASLAAAPPDAPAASAAAAKKCKKGQRKKGKRCVKKAPNTPAGPVTPVAPPVAPVAPPAGPALPGGVGQTPPQTAEQALAAIDATQDDAAVQGALGNGLLLERSSYASSGMFADYERIFFFPNGGFRLVTVQWNTVSGEKCDRVVDGSWSFVRGYRFTARGGGMIAVVSITANGSTGNELLAIGNADPSTVYVGANERQYAVNPHMLNGC